MKKRTAVKVVPFEVVVDESVFNDVGSRVYIRYNVPPTPAVVAEAAKALKKAKEVFAQSIPEAKQYVKLSLESYRQHRETL